tara:strand:+ start:5274 stop:5474 length:201 start_codon:yes stop_codon:yes gene_type:complete
MYDEWFGGLSTLKKVLFALVVAGLPVAYAASFYEVPVRVPGGIVTDKNIVAPRTSLRPVARPRVLR